MLKPFPYQRGRAFSFTAEELFMKKMILSILLTLALPLHGKPIIINDASDYHILDQFFKIMIREELFGYVLEGDKPLSSINIYPLDNLLSPQARSLKMKVLGQEAIDLWCRIAPQQKNFILKATKVTDHDYSYYELLFINRSKLKGVLEENLNLFRFHIGPTIESSSLTDLISSSTPSLASIIKGNNILFGILSGYGTYNSLMGSRAEDIQGACDHLDCPPFINDNLSMQVREKVDWDLQNLFLGHSEPSKNALDEKFFISTSIGFDSLKSEGAQIASQQEELPPVLLQENPRFIFGPYQCESNKTLFENIINTQKKIQAVLSRSDFLEYVLEKITGEKPVINCSLISPTRMHLPLRGNAEESMAEFIVNAVQGLDDEGVPHFVDAFYLRKTEDNTKPKKRMLNGVFKGLKEAQKNLKLADSQLLAWSTKKSVVEVVPKYVYFERMKLGQGKSIEGATDLLLSYVVENGLGDVLTAQHRCWVDISTTIPAFAHCMKGMKEGEVRQIYIHPAYGYGALTTISPCTSLVVKVTLHQINEQEKKTLNPLVPINLSWVEDPSFFSTVKETHNQNARYIGHLWGVWLSKSKDLNFPVLCDRLKSLVKDQNKKPLSEENYRLCNRVFWNLIVDNSEMEQK